MTRERPSLVVVDDERALAEAVADHFVVAARVAIADRGRFNVALAGGSTPKAAYELLSAEPRAANVAWDSVRFFFGDERCVGPDDDQSNYGMARRALLAPLAIPEERVFRMHGEDDPEAAARAYADVLRHELGDPPVLDLVMLGMGPDGHTASLFPGTDPATDGALLVRAPYVEKFATYRITLTPQAIDASREVAIATAGAAKADALAAVLDGPFEPTTYPVQSVRPESGRLVWYVDRAAAAKLR